MTTINLRLKSEIEKKNHFKKRIKNQKNENQIGKIP
jgi:hypothetical protein